MAQYLTPNVYVEEISTLPPSVAAVQTAIPAFIGCTQTALNGGVNVTNQAVRITSMLEYQAIYGGPAPATFTVNTVVDSNGNHVVGSVTTVAPQHTLYYNLQMFFANGGGPCYIVSIGDYSTQLNVNNQIVNAGGALDAIALQDEPTLIVFPDLVNIPDSNGAAYSAYANGVLNQCSNLKDRFAIFDVPNVSNAQFDDQKVEGDMNHFRNTSFTINNIDQLKYGAAYYPNLVTGLSYSYVESNVTLTGADNETMDKLATSNTVLYNAIKTALNNVSVVLPPSSTMAGVYASVDNQIGVWKAPANVSLASVISPKVVITDASQEGLNIDATAGKSINAIRSFTGKGTLVWGARTLAGNDNEWRYVSVRRLFILIEESLQKATAFAVFEPNNALTWLKLSTMIENFLTDLWQQGALVGSKASDAFFINVGLNKSMSAQDILEGRLIVEIGVAAVRPAEFIILRFSQLVQQS